MKYYLALFLVLFARVQSDCAEDRTKTEIVPCGITSAFGILTAFEKECSIIEITERFQRLYPRADASSMTLQELCGLIHSYDLQTLIARVDFDLLSNAQLPCILCLTKDFGGNKLKYRTCRSASKKGTGRFYNIRLSKWRDKYQDQW